MAGYFRPTELDDALRILGARRLTVIAGGTDFYPARVGAPLDDDVLDVTALGGLRGIDDGEDGVRIGALTTWTDVLRADLPPWFDGLKDCARELGAVQTQNAATVVGNVCNASPAADGIPCLLAMEARVELASAGGARSLPVAEFVTAPRRTARRDDEMVTAITLPRPAGPARAAFAKLGARRYMVISIVSVAAMLEQGADGAVSAARVAVGACSPVALRLAALERALVGHEMSATLGEVAVPEHLAVLSPISDFRGSADYRRDAALTMVRRTLAALGGRP